MHQDQSPNTQNCSGPGVCLRGSIWVWHQNFSFKIWTTASSTIATRIAKWWRNHWKFIWTESPNRVTPPWHLGTKDHEKLEINTTYIFVLKDFHQKTTFSVFFWVADNMLHVWTIVRKRGENRGLPPGCCIALWQLERPKKVKFLVSDATWSWSGTVKFL